MKDFLVIIPTHNHPFGLPFSIKSVLNQSMKSGFNASILNLFNFESKKLIKFLEKDSEIYDYVNKSKIIHLSKNPKILQDNGYSKFIFSFLLYH